MNFPKAKNSVYAQNFQWVPNVVFPNGKFISPFIFIDKYLNISFIMLGLNFDLLYFM